MADAKGTLHVVGPFETSALQVLDAGMQEVASGTHTLSKDLDPGIYRVIVQVPGSRDEKLVAIEPGKTAEVRDFHLSWDSVVPHSLSASKHEYQTNPAEYFSHQTHAEIGQSPQARLFLYVRTLGDARTTVPAFSLADHTGREVVACPTAGDHDLQQGWIALSVNLPAGMYQLVHEVPKIGPRAQAVFVEDGWETQMFVPWRELPEFAAADIQMTRKGNGFTQSNTWMYTRTEAASRGLANHRVVLQPGELQAFVDGKFENPMLGLIAAYALVLAGPVNYDDLGKIAHNLRALLPHSPDAELLELIAELRGQTPTTEMKATWPRFEVPPWFAVGTETLLSFAAHIKELCPATSWLGRVSMNLVSGSAWTRWDPNVETKQALLYLKAEVDAVLRDSRQSISDFVDRSEEGLDVATLGIDPTSATGTFLKQMINRGGPELVKLLKEWGPYDWDTALNLNRTAEHLATMLAPQFALPQSVVAEAVMQLLRDRFRAPVPAGTFFSTCVAWYHVRIKAVAGGLHAAFRHRPPPAWQNWIETTAGEVLQKVAQTELWLLADVCKAHFAPSFLRRLRRGGVMCFGSSHDTHLKTSEVLAILEETARCLQSFHPGVHPTDVAHQLTPSQRAEIQASICNSRALHQRLSEVDIQVIDAVVAKYLQG